MQLGPYTIVGPLGSGGMGTVFRALAPGGHEVAVKVLNRLNAGALGRFERERRLLAEFGEAHGFVPLLDSGTSPQGPFLVMPVMVGSLRDRLVRGPLPVEEALAIGRAVAAALGVAHDRKVVHRDLKPENILFTAEGRPLVSDLGLAKEHVGAGNSLSRTGEVRGSLHTMAPEQLRDSKRVGPRADVFALGATLYECLAGTPPFHGDHPVQVIEMIMNGRFAPLRKTRPEVPAWLATVVERCLSPRASRRPRNGKALVALLSPPAGHRRRLAAPALAAGLAPLVLVAGALAVWNLGRGAPAPEPPAPALATATAPSPPPPPPATLELADAPRAPRSPHLAYLGAAATGMRVATTLGQPSDAGMVQKIRISADGRVALTIALDGRLRVRDLATGRDLLDVNVSAGAWVYDARFVDDGAAIVVGHVDGQVTGWNLADGTRRFARRLHSRTVWGVHVVGRDRRFISVCMDGTIRSTDSRDVSDSTLVADLGFDLAGSAVLPDGGLAVVGGHGAELVCVDLASGATRWRRERTHAAMVAEIAVSADGALAVTCGADGRFGLWSVRDGELVRMTAGITVDKWLNHVRACVFWDEARLLTGGDDGLVRVWDRESGRELGRMAHQGCVQSMARAGDRLLVGCNDGTFHVWDVERRARVDAWPEHTGAVLALAWSRGALVSAGADRTVRRWDLTSGAATLVRREHEAAVVAIAARADSPWVVSSSVDGVVRAWCADRPEEPGATLARRGLPAWGLALFPSGAVGVVTQGGAFGRLQVEPGATPTWADVPDALFRCAAPLSDGSLVAGGARGRLCVLDARGVVTARADGVGDTLVTAVAVAADGRAAIAGLEDGRVVLWTLDDGATPRLLGAHAGPVVAVTSLPDGRAASASRDRTVRVWSESDGEGGRVDLTASADEPTCLVVTPDGQLAAGTARGVIVVLAPDPRHP